ncbi:hypothetical protein HYP93_gp43 [Stenotrophomonas phage Pokken]|uniref:Uncharacterized protein n=1 Tax=Stenotrophomonas phage Pokken TaxID=2596674 RepID=A0A5B9N5R9_9CAUD|nr:hypothetical protein HYP93_gp43 [Stenotrophomonas phage Pokken]QEG09314.1 hypothetical protein CPT_Pokken_096 [Stenotrophomonas phage Pokken]
MPSREDPLGDYDHIKPIPYIEAKQEWVDHLKVIADHKLDFYIQHQQHLGNQEVKAALQKKLNELDHQLHISARQI